MKVVIIGSGNVGTVLGRKLLESGSTILQVISKTAPNGMALAARLNASYSENVNDLDRSAELCIVAVGDQQIKGIVDSLPLFDGIVVHTAGSVSIEVLKSLPVSYGVIYPLQTLSKRVETLPVIPVLIDGNNEQTRKKLNDFALEWSPLVAIANDEKRLKMHVAAVIANNFTNHLMVLAENFCAKEGIDFKLLIPLVQETVSRLDSLSPTLLQTGPAVRGDIATIDKHLQLHAFLIFFHRWQLLPRGTIHGQNHLIFSLFVHCFHQ